MDKKTKEALQKCLEGCGGKPFAELSDKIAAMTAREFPDFGADVPEGNYFLLGKYDIHTWTNSRGNKSEILTAYIADGEGKTYEVSFAAFCSREFPFVRRVEDNEIEVETDCILPFYDKISQRTAAVKQLEAFTPITIKHARGHFANPYNTRVFNFVYTWVEKA